jgi:hypothetical protein
MDIAALQRAIGTDADGKWGPASRAALLDKFTNRGAPSITPGQMQAFADRLSVSLRQLAAVADVESGGAGFDAKGRPKILFERHWFHRITNGRFSPATFSYPLRGGYDIDSWDKLISACAKAPDAAFASASWGKFQVMGGHWEALRYSSPFAMAASAVTGEAAHYDMLCRFIEANNLQDEMRALSPDPNDCRAFARAYNGAAYTENQYHLKLARKMR